MGHTAYVNNCSEFSQLIFSKTLVVEQQVEYLNAIMHYIVHLKVFLGYFSFAQLQQNWSMF